jgi:Na+-translocating ferredoxin:NAD+ oxidoreductase RnfG subunit
VSRAKGRSETFDYAVIFDGNLSTRQVKVLDYRSPHGEAITGRSWLKQFANKTIDYLFEYHKNVDSMSGATISATSIIEDINLVKKNMVVLKRMGAL